MNSSDDRERPEDHVPSSSVIINGGNDDREALLPPGTPPVSRRNRRISDVRRTFCLFTFFNFLLIVLLWLIMLSVKSSQTGRDYEDIAREEVIQTDVRRTSFDMMYLAAFRATLLLLAYAVRKWNSRFPVATTTFITSGYAFFKVFYADYSGEESYKRFAIIIPLTTFVAAWLEAVFMDYRVLPKEMRAAQIVLNKPEQHPPHPDDVFRSPAPSVSSSDEDDDHLDLDPEPEDLTDEVRSDEVRSDEERRYVQQGEEAMRNVESILGMESVWNKEKSKGDGDVYTLNGPNKMKIFILKMSLRCPPEVVYKEVILRPESMPTWNRAVVDCQVLMRISNHTLVTYDVSAGAANGYIKPRDFVNVRRIEKQGQRYISAGMSTSHADKPPCSQFVRGNNDPGGFIVEKVSAQQNGCSFFWILNTDIKGRIPRYLVDKSLAEIMCTFASSLRQHLDITYGRGRSPSDEVPCHSRP